MSTSPSSESLHRSVTAAISRFGRFIVAELLGPHRVLSTSSIAGGETESARYLVNHQSCEGKEKFKRWSLAKKIQDTEHPEGIVDLTIAEIAKLRTLVGKSFAPIVVGQAWEHFDAMKKDSEDEKPKAKEDKK